MNDTKLTQKHLKQLLVYDKHTGIFIWRVARGSVSAGTRCSTIHTSGYMKVRLEGKAYLLHRLAWLYTHGNFPDELIDHIDRDKLNNKLGNLRMVTKQENSFNTNAKGYHYNKINRTYVAEISINGKKKNLGSYTTANKAKAAYKQGKLKYHKIKGTHE